MRNISGITFFIKYFQQLNYDGEWESDAFYVYLAGQLIGRCYGFPSDDDILGMFEAMKA